MKRRDLNVIRYRNVIVEDEGPAESGAGGTLLLLMDTSATDTLLWIWLATAGCIFFRATFGIIPIWPAV